MAFSLSSSGVTNGLGHALASRRPRVQLRAVSRPEQHSFGGMVSPRSPGHARPTDWASSERLSNLPEAFAAPLPMAEQRQSVWQSLVSLFVSAGPEDSTAEDDVPFEYLEEQHASHSWGHWPIAESLAVAKSQRLRSFVGTSVELDD